MPTSAGPEPSRTNRNCVAIMPPGLRARVASIALSIRQRRAVVPPHLPRRLSGRGSGTCRCVRRERGSQRHAAPRCGRKRIDDCAHRNFRQRIAAAALGVRLAVIVVERERRACRGIDQQRQVSPRARRRDAGITGPIGTIAPARTKSGRRSSGASTADAARAVVDLVRPEIVPAPGGQIDRPMAWRRRA